MHKSNFILFVAILVVFVTDSFGQHQRYAIRNGLGIYGGITQFDIDTDNFSTVSEQGFIGGMAATVELPHKWYTVSYNIQLSQNYFNVYATAPALIGNPNSEQVEYKVFTTQVALLFHVKLLQDYVTLDLGPMLQYNSNLELENDSQENYIVDGYDNLTADDITDVTKFNFNGAGGVTAGFRGFKLRAQYIYGFTNILNKLEKANLDTSGSETNKFKGNMNMWAFTAMIYF
ncbi:MAG: outer membrane beta-barrel protein [Flavobacteriaceae bacterium]|nr:outer membrane beta-barrel protein [Flavobacteriaceae bacterium]